jgi:hypothetical protein
MLKEKCEPTPGRRFVHDKHPGTVMEAVEGTRPIQIGIALNAGVLTEAEVAANARLFAGAKEMKRQRDVLLATLKVLVRPHRQFIDMVDNRATDEAHRVIAECESGDAA